jgi:acid phosphatase type 7
VKTAHLLILLCAAFASVPQPLTAQTSSQASPAKSKEKSPHSAASDPGTYTLVGAGDIAGCANLPGAEATARLIEKIPGTVFAAGDLAYEHGTYDEFMHCYQPTWGKFKDRTRPAPGNHEYVTADSHATGYFQYWGQQAGDSTKGYYSYDLGAWHIIVLNTNCTAKQLGGCGEGSPEEAWLRADLTAHANACVLAYGHHAMFSSGLFGRHARHPELQPFWADLYAAHADVMVAAHEHSYERFAPQNAHGVADPDKGIREFVVGTGGRSHTFLGEAQPNSEVRNDDTYGVLKLTLSPQKYTWEFIPEAGKTFHDSGEGTCHNAANLAK